MRTRRLGPCEDRVCCNRTDVTDPVETRAQCGREVTTEALQRWRTRSRREREDGDPTRRADDGHPEAQKCTNSDRERDRTYSHRDGWMTRHDAPAFCNVGRPCARN